MYHRILVGVNNTVGSRYALRQAFEYAGPFGARIVALFVESPLWIPPPMGCYAFEAVMRAYAERLSRRFHTPVEFRVRRGVPARTIVEQARLLGCDLIVLGHASDAPVHRWLTGSTARLVRQQAPCTVLVVRRNQARRAATATAQEPWALSSPGLASDGGVDATVGQWPS